jgi:hypothetical protein
MYVLIMIYIRDRQVSNFLCHRFFNFNQTLFTEQKKHARMKCDLIHFIGVEYIHPISKY